MQDKGVTSRGGPGRGRAPIDAAAGRAADGAAVQTTAALAGGDRTDPGVRGRVGCLHACPGIRTCMAHSQMSRRNKVSFLAPRRPDARGMPSAPWSATSTGAAGPMLQPRRRIQAVTFADQFPMSTNQPDKVIHWTKQASRLTPLHWMLVRRRPESLAAPRGAPLRSVSKHQTTKHDPSKKELFLSAAGSSQPLLGGSCSGHGQRPSRAQKRCRTWTRCGV